jgi:enoyl-CoA hydratase
VSSDLVLFERAGSAAIIRLNRESKLNALNRVIFEALAIYLDEIAHDQSCSVAILTGTGRAFCAGADIGEYWKGDRNAFREFQNRGRQLHDQIEKNPKPVIAAVNGFAFGGGFELALVCDLIVASERAQFGLPEPTLGLVPGGGGTQRLPRMVGQNRAKEILLTGRRLSALEAYEWGIVNAVTPADEEIGMALQLGEKIARQAPLAIQALKRLVNEGVNAPLETALSYEQQALLSLYATDDGQEGINAFMEKRPAVFLGR